MAAAKRTATTDVALSVQHSDLDAALFAIQQEMPEFQKTAINPHFNSKYVPLETILPKVLEIVGRHGVSVSQFPDNLVAGAQGVVPALTTTFTHVATREAKSATTPLMLGGKETAQAHAASITYMRRYGIVSALGIVTEKDDDGNAASFDRPRQAPPAPGPAPDSISPSTLANGVIVLS